MFAGLLENKRWPIGLDLGTHGVRAVQLAWTGDRWQALAAATAPLPVGLPSGGPQRQQALREAVEAVLAAGKFRGRAVVSCLPTSILHFKNLRLPPMPPSELRSAVEWEATDRLKIGKDHQVQFFDAGDVRQGDEHRREILLLAAPTHAIEEQVWLLRKVGLEPLAIDATPAGLARWAGAMDHDPESTQCVLDIGVHSTNVLLSRRGRVLFFKPIDIGGSRLDETIARQLNISAQDATEVRMARVRGRKQGGDDGSAGAAPPRATDQAAADAMRPLMVELAREVGLCLRYYGVTFRGRRPERVQIVSDWRHEPLLSEVLPRDAGLSLDRTDPVAVMDWSLVRERTGCGDVMALALAAGLSMRSRDAEHEQERGAA